MRNAKREWSFGIDWANWTVGVYRTDSFGNFALGPLILAWSFRHVEPPGAAPDPAAQAAAWRAEENAFIHLANPD